MALLKFALTPEGTQRLSDLLSCLAKFGDLVSLEAKSEKLTLTALNSSRTAYAAFTLDPQTFFISYVFNSNSLTSGGDRFTCRLYNRALQSVFKNRIADVKGRETTIDRCDVSIVDRPEQAECRLVVKLLSKHGMTKSFRLVYESAEVMHALFDKTAATQGWRVSSRVMREYVEYFGPKTEQLDLQAQDGKAIFTSFTEKLQSGKDALKQPLETAIAIHTADFEDFHMQDDMHIVIRVNDFRAIVTHAETLRGPISASFSYPSRPIQFSYQNFGVHSEFTLMTTGDHRAASSTPHPSFVSTRSSNRQQSAAPAQNGSRAPSEMPPPNRPFGGRSFASQTQQPLIRNQIQQSLTAHDDDPDPDSLFMPNGDGDEDDDHGWEPQEEDDEMLGWDASNEDFTSSMRPTIRDLHKSSAPTRPTREMQYQMSDDPTWVPTQRLEQINGLFD